MVVGSKSKPLIIICAECGEEKPHYAKGLCKRCYNRRYQQAHREEISARKCRYHREHPRDRRVYYRRWYQKHREEVVARVRHWQQENLGRGVANMARRRACKKAVANTVTPEQIEFERKIGEATYPGEELHLHHPVSFGKGGNHSWGNIMFIPASLNSSIGNKLPQEVYKQLAFA